GEERPKTERDVRPLEELHGISILVTALVPVDLTKIGRELRLLISAGVNVGMRRDHIAPRFQAETGRYARLYRGHGCLHGLLLGLLFEPKAEEILLLAFELDCF